MTSKVIGRDKLGAIYLRTATRLHAQHIASIGAKPAEQQLASATRSIDEMLATLDDDLLRIIALALARKCWRSVCDLACSSGRNASVLRESGAVWREAAAMYCGSAAQRTKCLHEIYCWQREAVERMLAEPTVHLIAHDELLESLEKQRPLLDGQTYAARSPPFDEAILRSCVTVPKELRGALELLTRLPQTPTLSSFVGSELEPLVLTVHAAMHHLHAATGCMHHLRALDTLAPLYGLVNEAIAPLKALNGMPRPRSEPHWRRRRSRMSVYLHEDYEHRRNEEHEKQGRQISEWLSAWSAGELRNLLSGIVSSLEKLLARACTDEAAVMEETDSSASCAVPATLWRDMIVQSISARDVREMVLCPSPQIAAYAAYLLSHAEHLKHMRPRDMAAAIKLAFESEFGEGVRAPTSACADRQGPFRLYARDARHAFDKVVATFREGASRWLVAKILTALPEEDWVCDESRYPGNGMGYPPILHWFAFYVLEETGDDRSSSQDEAQEDESRWRWHPAWAPSALCPQQHATLLALRMLWKGSWKQVASYGMLLGSASGWEPQEAAAVIHKALRQRGVHDFLPNTIWHIWKHLASERMRNDEHEYMLSASVCWQLADRWLGSRARCSALFLSALLHLCSLRRDNIMGCVAAERREKLHAAAVQASARILTMAGTQGEQGCSGTEVSHSDGWDSQIESDDSCAVAEAGWREWSWSLEFN